MEDGNVSEQINKDTKNGAWPAIIFMMVFYTGIVFYILLYVVKIDLDKNFVPGLVFQIAALVILTLSLLFISARNRSGNIVFAISAVSAAAVYNLIVILMNIFALSDISTELFVMFHLLVLFLFCLFIVPVMITGNKSLFMEEKRHE